MSSTTDYCDLKPDRYSAIINLLKQVARNEDVKNFKIELAHGCDKGDGYMGEKHTAILNGDNKSIKVFIKGAPTQENLRTYNDGLIRINFLIEIVMYEHIYPTMLKFQEDKHISEPFKNILDVLATSTEVDQEILVLPDARELGFQLWERTRQMDRAHVEAVFKVYGKFHACSYALKEQRPEVFKDLVDKLPMCENMVQLIGKGMTDIAKKVKRIFDPVKEKNIFDQYCEFCTDMMDIMQTTLKTDKFSVLTHGDCWSNNMLFKYEPTNVAIPSDICLIDFQLTRLGSPVLDLSYFLYSSAQASVYADLDRLLRVYHASLSAHMRALGSDPDLLFPYDELTMQWRRHCNFGVILSILLMKIVLMDKDETVDMNEALDTYDDIISGFNKVTRNDSLYYERVKALLEHLHKNDLFKRLQTGADLI